MAYKVPKLQPDDRLPRKYTPAGVEDDLVSLDSRAGDLENTVENGRLSEAALTGAFATNAGVAGTYARLDDPRFDGIDPDPGTPAEAVVIDSFDRSDNPTSLGSPDEGGTAWQTSTSTAFGVVSNQAKQDGTANTVWAVTDSGVADCTVSIELLVTENSNGVLFRFIDSNNYLRATINQYGVLLEKRDAGTFTTLATWAGAQATGAATLAVRMDGDAITVTRDGNEVGTHTLSSGDLAKFGAATLHGFIQGSYNAAHYWDDFLVETLATPPDMFEVMAEKLRAWAAGEAWLPAGSIVRNDEGVVTSAAVAWPDGGTGTFAATDTTGGTINAYTITHAVMGLKVTQPTIVRDSAGNPTSVPALVVEVI